jgi:hypothetical protein
MKVCRCLGSFVTALMLAEGVCLAAGPVKSVRVVLPGDAGVIKLQGKDLQEAFRELTTIYHAEHAHSMPIRPPQIGDAGAK